MYYQQPQHLNIQKWAEEDRPREKLELKGKAALTDAELLGILLGSGTRKLTAVDLAKQILAHVNNDLNKLAKLSVNDLKTFKGIGLAKAINIVSALELGRRRKDQDHIKLPKISSAEDVYNELKTELLDLDVEEFWVLLLNRSNRVIKKERVSIGGLSGTVVDPKIIFRIAIQNLAANIILVHNHPSGNSRPSKRDNDITKRIVKSGEMLEINVLDHVIFTDEGYFSYSESDLIGRS